MIGHHAPSAFYLLSTCCNNSTEILFLRAKEIPEAIRTTKDYVIAVMKAREKHKVLGLREVLECTHSIFGLAAFTC